MKVVAALNCLFFFWILARGVRFGRLGIAVESTYLILLLLTLWLSPEDAFSTFSTQAALAFWGFLCVVAIELPPFLKKRWASFRGNNPPWEITLGNRLKLWIVVLPIRVMSILFYKRARTPYDDVQRIQGEFGERRLTRVYDCFLSYKSEDADLVRLIAEQLLANDLKVWFAEYRVLTHNWNDFQREIDIGIKQSKIAIAFTNNRYAESTHCVHELTQIFADEVMGQGRVFEVQLPGDDLPHRVFPGLRDVPRFQGNPDPARILAFLAEQADLNVGGAEILQEVDFRETFHYDGTSYGIDTAGWESDGDRENLSYSRTIGKHRWGWNLLIGDAAHPGLGHLTPSLDDRAIFRSVMEFVDEYYRKDLLIRPRGIHLLWIRGRGHFAVTHPDFAGWVRKYSITLPHPTTSRLTEFVFTCMCFGPFDQFVKHVHLMDELVRSFEWHPGLLPTGPAVPRQAQQVSESSLDEELQTANEPLIAEERRWPPAQEAPKGWFARMVHRLKTNGKIAHAFGLHRAGMKAGVLCARRFPEVFNTSPWEPVPAATLQALHRSAEYRLANEILGKAFDTILSVGDELNASASITELARLQTLARDWDRNEHATVVALSFCREAQSRAAESEQLTERLADSHYWRAATLALGHGETTQARELLQAAEERYRSIECTIGVQWVADLLAHIDSI